MALPYPAAVLFDLDGTLLDTAPDFHAVLVELCREKGVEPPTYEALHEVVSEGGRAMTRLAFGLAPEHPDFPPLHQAFLDRYATRLCQSSRLYEGFEAILDLLDNADLPWGIVTNKPRRFTAPLIERLDLSPDVIVCPDDVSQAKPAPDALFFACKHLRVATELTWYVGDHPRDIEAGRAAGCPAIAAAWGYIPAADTPEQWGADVTLPTPKALYSLLSKTLDQD